MSASSLLSAEATSYVVNSQCTEAQRRGAAMVKELHDQIEVVAYRAFAEIVQQLGITGDSITAEQSDKILDYVKEQAHQELYRTDGYWSSRLRLLDEDGSQLAILIKEQFQTKIHGLARLVHDRDEKLTRARYHSLTDLMISMDDHNFMVKENLLRSWYRCPSKEHGPGREILEHAKDRARFYESLEAQLHFDIRVSVAQRQKFIDQYFPGIRAPEMGREFMNTLEVRDFLGESQVQLDEASRKLTIVTPNGRSIINVSNPDAKLIDALPRADIEKLFNEQESCTFVCRKPFVKPPLIADRSMTIKTFMDTYFPELAYKPSPSDCRRTGCQILWMSIKAGVCAAIALGVYVYLSNVLI